MSKPIKQFWMDLRELGGDRTELALGDVILIRLHDGSLSVGRRSVLLRMDGLGSPSHDKLFFRSSPAPIADNNPAIHLVLLMICALTGFRLKLVRSDGDILSYECVEPEKPAS